MVVAAGVQRLRDLERLEQSEQRHRHFVEHLPLGVAHTTPDGSILYTNAAACASMVIARWSGRG